MDKEFIAPILDYEKKDIQKLILFELKNEISFLVIHEENNDLYPLKSSDIAKLITHNPEPALITVPCYEIPAITNTQKCTWSSVWIDKKKANALLRYPNKDTEYTTVLLDLQKRAINKFWENHDPTAPPKSDEIIEWLINEGAAKRVAQVMDTIMRAEPFKKGGNRSRDKKAKGRAQK